jgi:hypothetical protein
LRATTTAVDCSHALQSIVTKKLVISPVTFGHSLRKFASAQKVRSVCVSLG